MSPRVTEPPGPVDVTRARSTPSSRAKARAAGAAFTVAALGAVAGSFAGAGESGCPRQLADHGADIRMNTFLEFDQRGTHLDAIADLAQKARDAPRLGRGDLHHRFLGLHRDQRLIRHHVIALGDVPGNDLRFLQAFAEVGQNESRHV